MKTLPRTAHWATEGPVEFRVFGIPRQWPKENSTTTIDKNTSRVVGRRVFHRDYRTRKNPITGKVEKYDHGYLKKWRDIVQDQIHRQMQALGLKPFPKNHPLAIGILIFKPKPKSCKLELPSQMPDMDNYEYAINNALKSTRTKKGPGLFPDGVLFYDDDCPVWILDPTGKVWATKEHPPGALITIQDAWHLRGKISDRLKIIREEKWQPTKQGVMI